MFTTREGLARALPAALAGVLLLASAPAAARSFRVEQIPNGAVNGCPTCHTLPFGGPRNAFGTEIELQFLDAPGPSGNVQWGPELATRNSDGDGASNGRELIDPGGNWSIGQVDPGDPQAVTAPGLFDVAIAVPLSSPLGAIALSAGLVALARTRRRRA